MVYFGVGQSNVAQPPNVGGQWSYPALTSVVPPWMSHKNIYATTFS